MSLVSVTIQDLTAAGPEQSAAQWGIALEGMTLERRNQSDHTLLLPVPSAGFNDTPLFAFEDVICVRVNRILTGSTYSGGCIKFVGKMVGVTHAISGNREVTAYKILGPWYDLSHTIYQQEVNSWNGSALARQPQPDVVLFTRYNSTTGGLDIINTAEQISDILNFLLAAYAAQGLAAPFQIGTIDTSVTIDSVNYPVNVPSLQMKPDMCANMILKCLQCSPDCALWFDYSTTDIHGNPLPTVHCKRQLALTPVTLAIMDGVSHKSLRLLPRPDLQVEGVIIRYKITNTVDGRSYIEYDDDHYPSGLTLTGGLRVPIMSVDISGFISNSAYAAVVVSACAAVGGTQAGKRAWWASQQSKFSDYHIRFQDENFNATTIPDATIINEDTGAAVSLEQYPNQLRDGSIKPWMTLSDGTPVVAVRCIVSATMTYAEYDSNGADDTDTSGVRQRLFGAKTESKRITLTNAVTGIYKTAVAMAPSEPIPSGLAQSIYQSLNQLQYEGENIWVAQSIGPDSSGASLGNVLNLSGGRAEWATMNALIQGIREDFGRGTTEISVGPARHLNAQELYSLLFFWRFRVVTGNPAARASGMSGDGSQIGLDQNAMKSDTDRASPDQAAAQMIVCPNQGAGASGVSQINHDASIMANWANSDVAYDSRVMQPRLATLADGTQVGIMCTQDDVDLGGGEGGGTAIELPILADHNQYVLVGYYYLTAVAVASGGTGYAVNDTVSIPGAGTPAKLTVTSISGGGSTGPITGLSITTAGVYSAAPASPATPINVSSNGSGASITLTTDSDSFNVAKPPMFRCPYAATYPATSADNIYGVTITYTWTNDQLRTASDGTNTVNEQIYRPYQAGDLIDAVPCGAIALADDSNNPVSVTWLDVTQPRVWAVPS